MTFGSLLDEEHIFRIHLKAPAAGYQADLGSRSLSHKLQISISHTWQTTSLKSNRDCGLSAQQSPLENKDHHLVLKWFVLLLWSVNLGPEGSIWKGPSHCTSLGQWDSPIPYNLSDKSTINEWWRFVNMEVKLSLKSTQSSTVFVHHYSREFVWLHLFNSPLFNDSSISISQDWKKPRCSDVQIFV